MVVPLLAAHACATASGTEVKWACNCSRTFQKSAAILVAVSTANFSSSLVQIITFDERSGTSVKGLPIKIAPERPLGEFSKAIASSIHFPNKPVFVFNSSPRTKAGMRARTVTGLAPSSIIFNNNLAER
ncbi:unannotated protein [freshwater metagenome]|uniref:Unannotated protein n=1 Tax=freshwater metagenome TaxID=449393 RepID=A0A6J7S1T1_9ZZZZ